MNIFGHLKAFNGHWNEAFFRLAHIQSLSDIKTLRLNCRRFCTTSSHLLLNSVYLELNQSSLSRLEKSLAMQLERVSGGFCFSFDFMIPS
jgi:hypothetical protein